MLKILFVCSRNRLRSLTAEHLFDGVNGHEVRSAGTEQGARIRVTAGHLGWADLVVAMEKRHVSRLRDKLGVHAWMIETVRGTGYRLRLRAAPG